MNAYYRLEEDLHIKGRWQLDGPIDDDHRNENEFWQGLTIELRGILRSPLWHTGIPLDFTMTVSAVPVLSDRLVTVLQPLLRSCAQLFPLDIEGHKGFHVMNTTALIDCFDEKKSEFIKWTEFDGRPDKTGDYRMVSRLRIDPNRVPKEMHAFRIKGWKIALIVSQAFVDAILPLNPTGVKLELVT